MNLGFDEFYDWKLKDQPENVKEGGLLVSPEQAARLRAAQWLMIPLTRAIDTLVIQVSDPDHDITEALRTTAKKCDDIVEWLEWNRNAGAFETLAGERAATGP